MYQMGNWLKKLGKNISGSNSVFMFIRAQFSSQAASIVDFATTVLLVKLFGVFYLYATFIGSVCGGIVNCSVNYSWTFKPKECKKLHVGIKYALVWAGSIALNTSGTYFMTETFMKLSWLRKLIEPFVNDFFIIPKIIVSLLVGFFWNYQMHRLFVYKNIDIRNSLWKNNKPQTF